MSEYRYDKDDIDKLTECSICLDDFKNAKSLRCLHTFCLQCLQKCFRDKNPSEEIICPLCCVPSSLPENGFEELPSNFFVKALVDAKKRSPPGILSCSLTVPCDGCSDDEPGVAAAATAAGCWATKYCTHCGQRLCDRCSIPHQKIPGGQHRTTELNAEVCSGIAKIRRSFCETHTGNKMEMYCVDCEMNVCTLCFAECHTKHRVRAVTEVARAVAQVIEDYAKKVDVELEEVRDRSDKLKDNKYKLIDEHESVENSVKQSGEKIKAMVDEAVSRMQTELGDKKSDAAKRIDDAVNQLSFRLAELESFKRYLREQLLNGEGYTLCTENYSNKIYQRAEELLKMGNQVDVEMRDLTVYPVYRIHEHVTESIYKSG